MKSFDINGLDLGLVENYDIALLFLSEPVLNIKPAYLPTPEEDSMMMEGDWVVVGWDSRSLQDNKKPLLLKTYAIKQQGESFISEIAEYEFKVGEVQSDVASVTATQADQFPGRVQTDFD